MPDDHPKPHMCPGFKVSWENMEWNRCGEGVSITQAPRGGVFGVFRAELGGDGAPGGAFSGVCGVLLGIGGGVGQRLPVALPEPSLALRAAGCSASPRAPPSGSWKRGPDPAAAAKPWLGGATPSATAFSSGSAGASGALAGAGSGVGVAPSSHAAPGSPPTRGAGGGVTGEPPSATSQRGRHGGVAVGTKFGSWSARRSCTTAVASGSALSLKSVPWQAGTALARPSRSERAGRCRLGVRPCASLGAVAVAGLPGVGPSSAAAPGPADHCGEATTPQGLASNSWSFLRHSPRFLSNCRFETRWRGSGVRGCAGSRCSTGTAET
mmetsp:Transcript_145664/g.405912  ORF Transcript_145664/g.405912 Transcript_145664/m.405912 type:complete len:324 (+) Transcript_145664:193-1164(+)